MAVSTSGSERDKIPLEVSYWNRRMQKRDRSAYKRQARGEVVIYLHFEVLPLYICLLKRAKNENLPNAIRHPGGMIDEER